MGLLESTPSRQAVGGGQTVAPVPGQRAEVDGGIGVISLARGVSLNAVAFGAGSVAGFGAMVLIGRDLGPAVAGHYFQAVALVSIACSIATCGAEPAAIRMLSQLRAVGELGSLRPAVVVAVLPVLLASVAVCVSVELMAPALAKLFASGGGESATLVSLRVIALAIPFWAVGRVFTAAGRGLGSNAATAVLDGFLQQSLRLLLVAVALILFPGLVSFTVAWTGPVVVVAVMAAAWLLHLLPRGAASTRAPTHRWRQAKALGLEFWGFAWARGVAYVFQVSTLWIGILLTGALASSSDAGVFGSLSRIAVVGTLALQSINLVLEPRLAAALARSDRSSAQRLYQVATGWAVVVGFPLFAMVAVFSPLLLGLFGPGYGGGALALAIVSCAMLWNIATGPVTAVLLMAGKSRWNLCNTAAALVVYVGAALALIPPLGLPGAALAWAAAIGVENGLPLLEVRRGLGLFPFTPPILRVMATALALFGAAGIAVRAAGLTNVAGISIAAGLGSGFYLWYLWRNAEELSLPILSSAPSGGRCATPGAVIDGGPGR